MFRNVPSVQNPVYTQEARKKILNPPPRAVGGNSDFMQNKIYLYKYICMFLKQEYLKEKKIWF